MAKNYTDRCQPVDPGPRDLEGQDREGDCEQADVRDSLMSKTQAGAGHVCEGISSEKRHLEEHHAGVPDSRRAPQTRQDHLANQWLDEEQQERTQEQRRNEEPERRRRTPRRFAGVCPVHTP
jgi:hypothetical protein